MARLAGWLSRKTARRLGRRSIRAGQQMHLPQSSGAWDQALLDLGARALDIPAAPEVVCQQVGERVWRLEVGEMSGALDDLKPCVAYGIRHGCGRLVRDQRVADGG